MDAAAATHDRAFPCLTCGYDLRALISPGAGEVRCPECGSTSQNHDLHQYGLRLGVISLLSGLILAPAAILIGSSWVFNIWSGTSVHTLLCLLLSPLVVSAHGFAVWHYLDAAVVLQRRRKHWLKLCSLTISAMIDIAACTTVAAWFL